MPSSVEIAVEVLRVSRKILFQSSVVYIAHYIIIIIILVLLFQCLLHIIKEP